MAHVTQCLGYDLMRKAGVPAPRCNFAHVTVVSIDGMSETTVVDGIYSHIDSIKDPFLRRNFGSDQDQGRLYEGTLSDFWTGSFRNTIEPKTTARPRTPPRSTRSRPRWWTRPVRRATARGDIRRWSTSTTS